MKELELLTIKYKIPLYIDSIPKFRGVIIKESKGKNSLFHNHKGDEVIYRYPTIQYKQIDKSAGILLIGDSTKSISDISSSFGKEIQLGDKSYKLDVDYIRSKKVNISISDTIRHYRINNWIGLNQENYKIFKSISSISKKVEFLETIMKGHILSFANGIGYNIDKELFIEFTEIEKEKIIKYKSNMMQAFDLQFRTNIFLPNYIGLGKGVSLGMGCIVETKKQKKHE